MPSKWIWTVRVAFSTCATRCPNCDRWCICRQHFATAIKTRWASKCTTIRIGPPICCNALPGWTIACWRASRATCCGRTWTRTRTRSDWRRFWCAISIRVCRSLSFDQALVCCNWFVFWVHWFSCTNYNQWRHLGPNRYPAGWTAWTDQSASWPVPPRASFARC